MEKKLERDESNKMLAGVAAGLADYLVIDVTWIRILFIFLVVFGFSGIWIYIILWIAVPARVYTPFSASDQYHEPFTSTTAQAFGATSNPGKKEKDNSVRYVAGIILIALGSYFLLDQFIVLPEWISLAKLWPLVFIAIGLVILLKPSKKDKVSGGSGKDPLSGNTNENNPVGNNL